MLEPNFEWFFSLSLLIDAAGKRWFNPREFFAKALAGLMEIVMKQIEVSTQRPKGRRGGDYDKQGEYL